MKKFLRLLLYLITPEQSYDEHIYVCREKRLSEAMKVFFWMVAAVLLAILVGSNAC